MTEQVHLRQAVARLVEAQEEALEVCGEALEFREEGFGDGDEVRTLREKELMREALEDVRAILGAASAEVRGVLGGGGAA